MAHKSKEELKKYYREYYFRVKKPKYVPHPIIKKTREEKLATKRAWYHANPDKVREMGRKTREKHKEARKKDRGEWAKNNRGWLREYSKKNYRKKQEELTGRSKPELCELCGEKGRICFDHNHKTGNFRGWICHRCNVVLGMVEDSCDVLEKMKDYLYRNS